MFVGWIDDEIEHVFGPYGFRNSGGPCEMEKQDVSMAEVRDKPHFDRVQMSNVNVVYTSFVSFLSLSNF